MQEDYEVIELKIPTKLLQIITGMTDNQERTGKLIVDAIVNYLALIAIDNKSQRAISDIIKQNLLKKMKKHFIKC